MNVESEKYEKKIQDLSKEMGDQFKELEKKLKIS